MAKGRVKRHLVFWLSAAVFALLIFSGIMPNPFPALWAWLSQDRPLAPDLAWQDRLGSRPDGAVAVGDVVAVADGSNAYLYRRATGQPILPATEEEWPAEWLVVAGQGDNAVVITSPRGENGYEVREAGRGRLVDADDQAVAVWGFREGWLDLRCDSGRVCNVRAFRPGQSEPLWRTDLPGERVGMLGANPPLAGPQPAQVSRIDPGVAGPQPMPPVLGFPVKLRGADVVVVLDTRTGRILQEVEQRPGERVVVIGERVIRSTLERHNGVCVSRITGHDAVSGDPVWGPEPYHLWGTGDVGCEQRVPPVASGAAVVAVAPDGRPMVLDAYDGRVLWLGELGESVAGLSSRRAIIRTDQATSVYAVRLGGDGDPIWQRRVDRDATLMIAQCGVIVADRHPNRIYVWDPGTGDDLLSLSTSAKALACASDGVVIANGRSIGFARFDTGDDGPDREPVTEPGNGEMPPVDPK